MQLLGGLFLLALVLGLAAAALQLHPRTPLPPEWNVAQPLNPLNAATPLTAWKLRRTAADPTLCRAALDRAGVAHRALPDKEEGPQCGIAARTTVDQLFQSRVTPVETRCGIALRLVMWDRHAVQPLAQDLLGTGVTTMDHFGSYSCRTIAGSQRMSQHARANAIDIAGFRTTDGRHLRLIADWGDTGAEGQFLRAVRDAACTWFTLVLSPDYNAAHRDHFHFDQGRWSRCR